MWVVKRPIEGISLNGDEYLLDENGNVMYFATEDLAKDFLRSKADDADGIEDDIENFYNFEDVDVDYLLLDGLPEEHGLRGVAVVQAKSLADAEYRAGILLARGDIKSEHITKDSRLQFIQIGGLGIYGEKEAFNL